MSPTHIEVDIESCQQDRQVEWLGDVVVGAQFQRFDNVLRLVFGGRHEDRHLHRIPQPAGLAQHLEAVDFRHHDVEKHGVVGRGRIGSLKNFQRLTAALDRIDDETCFRQLSLRHHPVHLRIVDQKNPASRLIHGEMYRWRKGNAIFFGSRTICLGYSPVARKTKHSLALSADRRTVVPLRDRTTRSGSVAGSNLFRHGHTTVFPRSVSRRRFSRPWSRWVLSALRRSRR